MLRETNLQSSGHVEGMGSASLPIATPYAIAMSLIPEQKNYHWIGNFWNNKNNLIIRENIQIQAK